MNSNVVSEFVNEASQRLAAILTGRENEILLSLSQGRANKEIAAQMNISVPTVRTHLRNIYGKLAVRSRSEAIVKYFNETRPARPPQPATVPHESSREKHAPHRRERRSIHDFLRRSLDAEDDSLQFKQFGE